MKFPAPILLSTFACLLLAACATSPPATDTARSGPDAGDDDRPTAEEVLVAALDMLDQDRTTKAIDKFDEVIAWCKTLYDNREKRVFAARSNEEANYYILLATEAGEDALIAPSTCGDVLYFKAFASLDLGRVETAEELLKQAVRLAPGNAMYLSELGHVFHVKRDWQTAQSLFLVAEHFANLLSPEEVRAAELLRAKRGVGYSLVELGLLEDAEKKFEECLDIDAEDAGARHELRYIEQLRSRPSVAEEKAETPAWEF